MAKTRLQLVRRAVKELGMLALTTETFNSVDELVDSVTEGLERRNILAITSLAAIPEEHFIPVAYCLAEAAVVEMGIEDEKLIVKLAGRKERAEADLVLMQRGKVAS